MPESLPPAVLAELAPLEAQDRATITASRSLITLSREDGRITATLKPMAPELTFPAVTIEGQFAGYGEAVAALVDSIGEALEHARAGLPHH